MPRALLSFFFNTIQPDMHAKTSQLSLDFLNHQPKLTAHTELVDTIPGMIGDFWWLQNSDLIRKFRLMFVWWCSYSSLKINKFLRETDEEDQTIPPPHPSRTATRSPKGLRVPRRNPEDFRYFGPSRTAKDPQSLCRILYTIKCANYSVVTDNKVDAWTPS
ncbi:hypothetical protein E3N88_22957 [Mikania micrantha]|uniref:Uncharacterized protein n=1 Tax=Mikania micrantha TaxID=192012 RepID=A0A5N6NBX1_9ASTR|nr:hypothetical protein E3N88_22957 [Mikania micrantha]